MPHEDGPAYYPVVATLSLGSHALFHYYRYQPLETSPAERLEDQSGEGRTIDPDPVLSILLEPRSLVITTSSMYSSHLHGIDGVMEDVFVPPAHHDQQRPSKNIANANLLTSATAQEAVANGGVLKRGVRYSLTCRDVEKVTGGIAFAKR